MLGGVLNGDAKIFVNYFCADFEYSIRSVDGKCALRVLRICCTLDVSIYLGFELNLEEKTYEGS